MKCVTHLVPFLIVATQVCVADAQNTAEAQQDFSSMKMKGVEQVTVEVDLDAAHELVSENSQIVSLRQVYVRQQLTSNPSGSVWPLRELDGCELFRARLMRSVLPEGTFVVLEKQQRI